MLAPWQGLPQSGWWLYTTMIVNFEGRSAVQSTLYCRSDTKSARGRPPRSSATPKFQFLGPNIVQKVETTWNRWALCMPRSTFWGGFGVPA